MPSRSTAKAQRKPTQPAYCSTLLRGLSILRCFSESNEALSATDLARITGIPQPTIWRFCQSLQSEGYLTTDESRTRFRPGLALLGLGFSAISHFGLAQHARQYLTELADRFHVVAGVAVPDGLVMRVVDRQQSSDAVLSYNIRIGSTLPVANSSSGWAYLAGLDSGARRNLIDRIAGAEPEVWNKVSQKFYDALDGFASNGVVINAGSFHAGLTGVAIPVFGKKEHEVAALYCSGITSTLTEGLVLNELAPKMKRIASDLRVALAL